VGPVTAETRIQALVDRVMALPADDVSATLTAVRERFGDRHHDLDEVLEDSFAEIRAHAKVPRDSTRPHRALLGASFVHEYSIELRTGMIDAQGEVVVDPPLAPCLGHRQPQRFEREVFLASLREVLAENGVTAGDAGHQQVDRRRRPAISRSTADVVRRNSSPICWLSASRWRNSNGPCCRSNFPAESRGMADARFTQFVDDDGSVVYLGTDTAFDGFHILPQLIETQDFSTFRIATLTGAAARNKGIAVFPRRINGRYVALARSDNENNYVMYSDHLRVWQEAEIIQVPVRSWELIQIGNNGAPIETDAGWLVITHGVGPFRTYALGAILLDLDDPRRVIGHLPEPLLTAAVDERDGYVPNVVYSCGQVVHAGRLVIAYGASDRVTRFASLPLDTLLHALTSRSSSLGS